MRARISILVWSKQTIYDLIESDFPDPVRAP